MYLCVLLNFIVTSTSDSFVFIRQTAVLLSQTVVRTAPNAIGADTD